VKIDAIRDELKNRGFLDLTDNRKISATGRKLLQRAKAELFAKKGHSSRPKTSSGGLSHLVTLRDVTDIPREMSRHGYSLLRSASSFSPVVTPTFS
jgi:hypothetical protein